MKKTAAGRSKRIKLYNTKVSVTITCKLLSIDNDA